MNEAEKTKLQLFNNIKLDRRQTEIIIGRNLTNREWRTINKDYRKIFKPIAVQTAKAALKKRYLKPTKEPSEYLKRTFQNIAAQAAKRGERKQLKNATEADDKYYFVKSLFKNDEDEYEIRKISEYYNTKYKTTVSNWKIFGYINFMNIQIAMQDLVTKVCERLPSNAKIQISLKIANSDRQPHTPLLSREDIANLLSNWVNFFLDYYDIDIEDVTFKLTAIEVPEGAGRPNSIITLDNKSSITRINNNDSLCFMRALLVSLSYNKAKLEETFKGKLTEAEIRQINCRKKEQTRINEGIFSVNEVKYIRQGGKKKLQTILSQACHRIYNVPIRDAGNDFSDIKFVEEKLDIEIQVYNMDTRQIYAGLAKPIKIYLILHDNHYDAISKLPAFLGTNARTWEAKEKLKCEACKNSIECTKADKTKCDECGKTFYSQNCNESHIKN